MFVFVGVQCVGFAWSQTADLFFVFFYLSDFVSLLSLLLRLTASTVDTASIASLPCRRETEDSTAAI